MVIIPRSSPNNTPIEYKVEATNIQKCWFQNKSSLGHGKNIHDLVMCLISRSPVSRLVPLIFQLKPSILNSHQKRKFKPSGPKSPSWIGVGNECLYPINKKGPTCKPNSSRLGTCHSQNSFTWAHWSPFRDGHFECVWPPHEYVLTYDSPLTMNKENRPQVTDELVEFEI